MNFDNLINWLVSSGFHPLFGMMLLIAVYLTISRSLLLRANPTLPPEVLLGLKFPIQYIYLITQSSIALGVYSCSKSIAWALLAFLLWKPIWTLIVFLEPYIFKCGLIIGLVIYPAFEYYSIGRFTLYSGVVVGLMVSSLLVNAFLQFENPIIPRLLSTLEIIQCWFFFEGIVIAGDGILALELLVFTLFLFLREFLWKLPLHFSIQLLPVLIFPALIWLFDSRHAVFYIQTVVSIELTIFFLCFDWRLRLAVTKQTKSGVNSNTA